jgi:hypothetical protein
MSRRRLKPGHNPGHYYCANPACKRTTPLQVSTYQIGSVPRDDAADVHRVHEPLMGGFTLLCSACGHYTVVSRHPWPPEPRNTEGDEWPQ